jgi:hypothetical protein
LELAAQQPHDPYDMDEYGRVTVEDAPANSLLSSLVGQRIDGAAEVYDATLDTPIVAAIGIVLRFPAGGIRILNIADELVIVSDQVPGTTEIDVRSPR